MSGCLLFAVSCYMNSGMDQNYGGRQSSSRTLITAFDFATQQYLNNSAADFALRGSDAGTATSQAISSLKHLVQ